MNLMLELLRVCHEEGPRILSSATDKCLVRFHSLAGRCSDDELKQLPD